MAGFCFGVRRALEKAESAVNEKDNVYALGPLIHNAQEVQRLSDKGIHVVDELKAIDAGTVIIRTHGAPPSTFEEAQNRGVELIDATCPLVKAVHKKVARLDEEDYQVIIIGDPSHPEVQGIVGWTPHKAYVVQSEEDIERLPDFSRVGVVAQTTQRKEKVDSLVARLEEKYGEVKSLNTICTATAVRQEAARRLSQEVDLMIVVGGRHSSNTRKLADVCSDSGTPAHLVEKASELEEDWFHGVNKVGLTAGASTPEWMIKEVMRRMEEIKNSVEEVTPEVQESQEESTGEKDLGLPALNIGDTVKGTVVRIEDDSVLVDIGHKSEGVIPINELGLKADEKPADILKEGQEIVVRVLSVDDDNGLVLSLKKVEEEKAWTRVEEAYNNGDIIVGPVTEEVKGGLLVDVGLRAFMPASHVERGYVSDLSQYVGREVRVKVIELDRSKNRVILSQKEVMDEEFEAQKEKTWNELAEGQVRKGIVKGVTDFGAFVDLGGVDGLLHVSEMAWGRVEHPSDVVAEGQEIDVKILKVDRENDKISLGLKQILPDPWNTVDERYKVDSFVEGRVMRLAPFGAFVQLEPGVEGLIHISQLADHHVATVDEVVKEGDLVKAKVLRVQKSERKISLSLKEGTEKKPVPKQVAQPVEETSQPITLGDMFGDLFEETKDRINGKQDE